MAPTCWGVAGCGFISSDFVTSLKFLPAEEHRLVAVAARSLEDAKVFAAKHGAETSYGSYEELAKDPRVGVVYIGVIHPHHLRLATLMIEAGKHVLCEKPLCMNLKETRLLVNLAKEKKVFLMEALWSSFFPVYKEVTARIKSGEIGDVVQVNVDFGQALSNVDRVAKKELGGGATLDIGIYCIRFASLVMEGDHPLKVQASGHLNQNGVDETVSATLVYSRGRIATLMCTTKGISPCQAVVVGTKGTIKVDYPFWCPEGLESPSGRFNSPLPKTELAFHFHNSVGMIYQAAEVHRCLNEGLGESPGMTHQDTLLLAEIMEQIRTQVGVSYTQDD